MLAVVFINGLTPYLEMNTDYGWNIYSNLVTVDGESNHLLIRSTLPLRSGHEDLAAIVESDDHDCRHTGLRVEVWGCCEFRLVIR
jgi:hypothetical protein